MRNSALRHHVKGERGKLNPLTPTGDTAVISVPHQCGFLGAFHHRKVERTVHLILSSQAHFWRIRMDPFNGLISHGVKIRVGAAWQGRACVPHHVSQQGSFDVKAARHFLFSSLEITGDKVLISGHYYSPTLFSRGARWEVGQQDGGSPSPCSCWKSSYAWWKHACLLRASARSTEATRV